MANFKNTEYFLVTGKQSVPVNVNKTGTISTVGNAVVGVGTLFKTEMHAGSWLVDESQDEVRRVMRVESNTLAYLSDAFTADIAALTTPSVIPKNSMNVRSVSLYIDAALADGEIDGIVLAAGTLIKFEKNSDNKRDKYSFIEPVIVDGTGTSIAVTVLR